MVLCLAGPAARSLLATSAQAGERRGTPRFYVVKGGDTLWGIAAKYAVPGQDPRATVDAIAAENGVDAGSSILPGQRLTIP